MTAIDRAAEVIAAWCWEHSQTPHGAFRAHAHGLDANTRYGIAEALMAAGWHDGPKLSDADRAVFDAADEQAKAHHKERWLRSIAKDTQYDPCPCGVCVAVRARRETQP